MNLNIIPSISILNDEKAYRQMVELFNDANVTEIRCNISTLPKEDYINCIKTVNHINSCIGDKKFNLMIDVPIPKDKSRIEFYNGSEQLEIKKGEEIYICRNKAKVFEDKTAIYVNSNLNILNVGDILVIGDGIIELEIIEDKEAYYICHSLNAGCIGFRNGIATKNSLINISSQDKLIKSIEIIKELKPDCIALSYIESKEDINFIKNQIQSECSTKIMSKVESMNGIYNLKEIIENSDSIMIPRGCLSLNAGISNLLFYQDFINDECKKYGIDAYIAAGILPSLSKSNYPSRADICDIGYIIKSGIKNIILSGSTCKPQNFNKAVKYLNELSQIYMN